MKLSLFEIEKSQVELMDQLVENGGELTPELEEALKINQQDLQTKGINYGFVVKQLEGECEIIDAQIKRLQGLKKSRENAAERLKFNLAEAMRLFDLPEIKTPVLKINFRKSESMEVVDINLVPDQYKTGKITWQADKVTIKEAIKAGAEIPGAHLQVNQNIQIK